MKVNKTYLVSLKMANYLISYFWFKEQLTKNNAAHRFYDEVDGKNSDRECDQQNVHCRLKFLIKII